MPSSNSANHSDPTLSKLLDIDSDLEAQAAQLEAQLSVIQEKRKSLQSVINIFSSTASATSTPAIDAIAPDIATTPVSTLAVEAKESNGAASKNSASKQKQKTRSTTKSKAPSTRSGKTINRGNDLQAYMQSAFQDASLPQAVLQILEREPDEVWRIPEIIDSIFVDEIPKNMRSKASTRVATVLSNGLKENKWYRGKTGHYSLSQSAARANSSS